MTCRAIVPIGLLGGVLLASQAFPCTIVSGSIPTPEALVADAEAIVLAQAVGLSDTAGVDGTLAGSPTQIRFDTIRVLKGTPPGERFEFNGVLRDHDDPNDERVPYTFVRPGGRSGNCFALGYRAGAKYLLFLKHAGGPPYAQGNRLTPYWSPLAPTNEQVFGDEDRWLQWVVERLTKSK